MRLHMVQLQAPIPLQELVLWWKTGRSTSSRGKMGASCQEARHEKPAENQYRNPDGGNAALRGL